MAKNSKIIQAVSIDTTIIITEGVGYDIFTMHPTPDAANECAADCQTMAGRRHQYNMTKAIVRDLGADAGRHRFAVFIAMGDELEANRT